MIVRWGLDELPGVLDELSIARPLLVSTARWRSLELPVQRRFHGARAHGEAARVAAAHEHAGGADGLVALGGGSAIDTAKAVAAALDLPVVSVPTTYSGAEWTAFFGVRDAVARVKTGGFGARTAAIVYEPALTVGLSRVESGGTALNALAHCAEALYAPERDDATDADALAGAALVVRWLEPVLSDGRDVEARRGLLEGAMYAGSAMRAGVCVGHAMAQALGGRYGLPHGAMNALSLPVALRFNAGVAAAALERLGAAMAAADPAARSEQLAALVEVGRLRDHGVPRADLPELAAVTAQRPAALANPRPATADAILGLLAQIW